MSREYTEDDVKRVSPLELVALRPGMYWHASLNPFHALVAFLAGYGKATKTHRASATEGDNLIIPDDFHAFVSKHFAAEPIQRWQSLIEQHTKTPEEAVTMLVRLRIAYDEEKQGRTPRAGVPPEKLPKAL